MTDPLPSDLEVTGPRYLHFWAEIDQEDTNWIIIIKDAGPDVSVQTEREGEIERLPGIGQIFRAKDNSPEKSNS